MSTLKKVLIASLVFAALAGSCVSTGNANSSAGLSIQLQQLVQEAVFEVVIKKPATDTLTYDKELDWGVVPWAIRNDKYYSIGTAFAISTDELVTAFHVLGLGEQSDVFTDYFVRDSEGNVFEIDAIQAGAKERDFVVFTVKDKKFSKHFTMRENIPNSTPVYSVGNAYGEGIIVRNGLITGTVPEEDSGRWKWLRSSADGNPGNSGGPLVDQNGAVVGVVVALKDNILYSLPVSELLKNKEPVLQFRQKLVYGHLILSNQLNRTYEHTVQLPAHYKAVRKDITETYKKLYPGIMEELFAAAPEFVTGPNNEYLLYSHPDYSFPELSFVNKDDNNWKLSDLKVDRYTLPDDGFILISKVSSHSLVKIDLPDTTALKSMMDQPKKILDMFLQGFAMSRSLGGAEKYRILSFGEPTQLSTWKDKLGRVWTQAWWTVQHEDHNFMMMLLPMPDGIAALITYQPTSEASVYEWDMRATCEKIQTAYRGSMAEWQHFLSHKEWIPEFFSELSFEWNTTAGSLKVSTNEIDFALDRESMNLTEKSTFMLSPSWHRQDDKIIFGVRKLTVSQDSRGKDVCVMFKYTQPAAQLGKNAMEEWDTLNEEKSPFDGVPRIDSADNTGAMGAIIRQVPASKNVMYSLYLAIEAPGTEETIQERFNAVRKNFVARRP